MSRLDGERAVIVPNKYLSSRVGGFEGVQISRIESKSMQKNFVREILWLSTRRNDIQIWVADESENGRDSCKSLCFHLRLFISIFNL